MVMPCKKKKKKKSFVKMQISLQQIFLFPMKSHVLDFLFFFLINKIKLNYTVKSVLKATCIKNHLHLKATISDPNKDKEVEIYLS